jgi:hypothetical protein
MSCSVSYFDVDVANQQNRVPKDITVLVRQPTNECLLGARDEGCLRLKLIQAHL